MADNYLEKHQAEYEKRRSEWLLRKKLGKCAARADRRPQRPDDEAL